MHRRKKRSRCISPGNEIEFIANKKTHTTPPAQEAVCKSSSTGASEDAAAHIEAPHFRNRTHKRVHELTEIHRAMEECDAAGVPPDKYMELLAKRKLEGEKEHALSVAKKKEERDLQYLQNQLKKEQDKLKREQFMQGGSVIANAMRARLAQHPQQHQRQQPQQHQRQQKQQLHQQQHQQQASSIGGGGNCESSMHRSKSISEPKQNVEGGNDEIPLSLVQDVVE